MPEYESRRFAGTIRDAADQVLGEARLWATGERGAEGGAWHGWLRVADLGGKLAPGRYTVTAFAGWIGEFEVGERPPTRVFETDLLAITGIGGPPWPPAEDGIAPARRPHVAGSPWQGAQGIPPYKELGDNPSAPPRHLPLEDQAD